MQYYIFIITPNYEYGLYTCQLFYANLIRVTLMPGSYLVLFQIKNRCIVLQNLLWYKVLKRKN